MTHHTPPSKTTIGNAVVLPWTLKASWGVGGLGSTSLLYLINMLVMYFLVRHVGIAAATAGLLLALTRAYDIVVSPIIGRLSDRTASRWGRRRPWMLAGAILAPIACIAVFHPPAWPLGAPLLAFALLALCLYCTAYSLFAIAHVALGAEMTDDYRERASLMSWRTFFIYISGVLIAAGAPGLIDLLGRDRAAYQTMSWIAAVVVGVPMLWTVTFTRGARELAVSTSKIPLTQSLRATFTNKPFLIILITKMMGQLGTAFAGASSLFFFAEVLGQGERDLFYYSLISNIVGIACVPIWNRVLQRVERRPLLATLLAGSALAYLSWFVAVPDESPLVFALRAAALGGFGSGSVLVAMTMLADTIEYDRLTSGDRREGLYVGAYELMQTTSFIFAPLIAGFAFSLAGLIAGDAGHGHQPDSALTMIRIAMGLIPATCATIGALVVWRYRLTGERLAELRAAASVANLGAVDKS